MKPETNCPICGAEIRKIDDDHKIVTYKCDTKKYFEGLMEGQILVKGFGCKGERSIPC